ncbi:12720_t:CDS:2, partial [Dentiscutata erythropus]
MSYRNAKKHVKISTANSNKRSHKRKEVAASTDNSNDPLDNIIIPQSKNADIKKGHKCLSLNNYNNNTQSKSKRGRKKTHKTAVSQSSQIISELLNDNDTALNNISNDDDILDDYNTSNNVDTLDDIFNNDDAFNEVDELADQDLPSRPMSTGSNNQNILTFKSRTSNQIQKEIISSNRTVPSRLVTLRENSPIYNNLTSELEPRNEFNFSNKISRTKPITVSNSRNNDQFNYNSRKILLGSGNNTMNIQMNNTCNMMNTLIFHSETINEVVPLSFDKMLIYQLSPVVEGSQFMPFTFPRSSTTILQNQGDKIKANRDFLEELKYLFLHVRNSRKGIFEELVLKIFSCELNSTEGVEYLHIANRHFDNFINSLVNNIIDLISDFKETRSMTGPLQKEEILAFIDESATSHMLNRWLNATNVNELKIQNSMRYLCRFIQQEF